MTPQRQIADIIRSGKGFSSTHLGVRVKEGVPQRTVAVIISSKVAPRATQRNRLRRRVREMVRTLLGGAPRQSAFAVIIRSPDLPDPAALRAELLSLLEKSAILSR